MYFLKLFLKSMRISAEGIPAFAKLLLTCRVFSFFMDEHYTSM